MSLEQIKEKLKRKPVAQQEQGVYVSVSLISFDDDTTKVNIDDNDGDNDGDNDDNVNTNATMITLQKQNLDYESIMKKLRDNKVLRVVNEDEVIQKKKDPTTVFEDVIESTKRTAPSKLTEKLTIADISRLEDDENEIIVEKVRRTRQPPKGVSELPPEEWVDIENESLITKIPTPNPGAETRVSSYYMNNRKHFVNFINSYFSQYRDDVLNEELSISCDDIGKDENADFKLLIHQKIVRDYLNLYTPYRGLLLFHGLGSGKTCSSIAIAEGMNSAKKVHILTPKSLKRNYMEELKKCGDRIFKKDQHWKFISVKKNADIIPTLSAAIGITEAYIKKKKGVWLMDQNKESNYNQLEASELKSLDDQIDEMIENKYHFIKYNGLRRERLRAMTDDYKTNIFDHSVVIIDEAHNFISRIANKLKKEKDVKYDKQGDIEKYPISIALVMYEMLMQAQDVRIVFLTGTPIINYPNELGILFNILRGYIKTWNVHVTSKEGYAKTSEKIKSLFGSDKFMDTFEYTKDNVLKVTRNPFGFETSMEKGKYAGVTTLKKEGSETYVLNERGQISDDDFKKRLFSILRSNDLEINPHKTEITYFKALPDDLELFNKTFLGENQTIVNESLFKSRILGLTSYFRSAQEGLLPKYDTATDFQVIKIPMSDYQLGVYESARSAERKEEIGKRKKAPKRNADGLFEEPTSTYRIFSRLYCNFVMPIPPGRPLPREDKMEESYEKATGEQNKKGSNDLEGNDADEEEGDEVIEKTADVSYPMRIANAMKYLQDNGRNVFSKDGLETYSPKFLAMIENISDPDHQGLHLVYSQFRTMEGIGLFKMALDFNGYAQFKVKKGADGIWGLNINEEDFGKPMYALYTGTESDEEKELIRNIYNSNWDPNLPITKTLGEIANHNHMGEIIKVLMITASGSEGINLRSTRFVHIMEPYWHPTRKDQIIGRARRICSHKALPEDMQDVRVFMYLMEITKEQLTDKVSKDMKLKDLSKLQYPVTPDSDKKEYRVQTSDETLFEISTIKEKVISGLTRLIKEASIDCAVYSKRGTTEQIECVQYGQPRLRDLSYLPDISKQPSEQTITKNQEKITWRGQEYELRGKKYIYRKMSNDVANLYDVESYYQALENPNIEPRLVAIEEKKNGKLFIRNL
jgi:hypothetical protein